MLGFYFCKIVSAKYNARTTMTQKYLISNFANVNQQSRKAEA